jgi:hypothetical protein
LRFKPDSRLGFKGWDEIKRHRFFKKGNFDWKALEEKRMKSPLLPILNLRKPENKTDCIDVLLAENA